MSTAIMKKNFEEVVKAARIACYPLLHKNSSLRLVITDDIEFIQINADGTETIIEKTDPLLNGIDTSPSGTVETITFNDIEKYDKEIDDVFNGILSDAGYSLNEYLDLVDQHFMDFSSDNPDEWIIRYDPEHAYIVYR